DFGSISSYDTTKGGLWTDLKPHFPLPSEQTIAVLLVDEAQDLSTDALQTIQLLTNLQSAGHSVLQVVLVGSPQIDQRLNAPGFVDMPDSKRPLLWTSFKKSRSGLAPTHRLRKELGKATRAMQTRL